MPELLPGGRVDAAEFGEVVEIVAATSATGDRRDRPYDVLAGDTSGDEPDAARETVEPIRGGRRDLVDGALPR